VADGVVQAENPVVEITGFSKTFPGQVALLDFQLALRAGEIHALVGENGSGKSTLIKCLSGYHTPDDGAGLRVRGVEVTVPYPAKTAADHGLLFVHQDFGIVSSLTVMENMALGNGFATRRAGQIDWKQQGSRTRAALSRLGRDDISPAAEASTLSSSSQAAVAIARTLDGAREGASLIVLDEPTAALPEAEVSALFDVVRRLADTGVAVLFVSHRLKEVFELCHRVTVLRDAKRVGTYDVASLTERELVQRIVGRDLAALYPDSVAEARADVALAVRGLSGKRLRDAAFDAHRGEILGIAGLQGSGRSELMRLLFGAQARSAGTVTVKGQEVHLRSAGEGIRAGIALVPENRIEHGVLARMTMAENLSLPTVSRYWRGGRLRRGDERARIMEMIREFNVQPPEPDRLMGRFSGGNQQKGILAKWIETDPTVLLLDEPVQGVDVGSKREIYQLIERLVETRGTTVVMTSSDFEDLHAVCHRVLVLREGRIAAELTGANKTVENMIEHAYLAAEAA